MVSLGHPEAYRGTFQPKMTASNARALRFSRQDQTSILGVKELERGVKAQKKFSWDPSADPNDYILVVYWDYELRGVPRGEIPVRRVILRTRYETKSILIRKDDRRFQEVVCDGIPTVSVEQGSQIIDDLLKDKTYYVFWDYSKFWSDFPELEILDWMKVRSIGVHHLQKGTIQDTWVVYGRVRHHGADVHMQQMDMMEELWLQLRGPWETEILKGAASGCYLLDEAKYYDIPDRQEFPAGWVRGGFIAPEDTSSEEEDDDDIVEVVPVEVWDQSEDEKEEGKRPPPEASSDGEGSDEPPLKKIKVQPKFGPAMNLRPHRRPTQAYCSLSFEQKRRPRSGFYRK